MHNALWSESRCQSASVQGACFVIACTVWERDWFVAQRAITRGSREREYPDIRFPPANRKPLAIQVPPLGLDPRTNGLKDLGSFGANRKTDRHTINGA